VPGHVRRELRVRGRACRLAQWWLLARVGRTGRYLLDDLKYFVGHGMPSPRNLRQLKRAAVGG
jgi:hypothetical protein